MSFLWHILRLQSAALRLAATMRQAVAVSPFPAPVVTGHPMCGWFQEPRYIGGNTNDTATTALLSKRYPGFGSERLDR